MSAADDLRALSAAATPAPWTPWGDPGSYVHIWTADERIVARDTPAPDAEFIAWCRNHADALTDLAEAVKAMSRHRTHSGTWCRSCGMPWPCPTERAHRALDALEATDG